MTRNNQNDDEKMQSRPVGQLTVGYHRNIAPDDEAAEAGLHWRSAIVMDSYCPEKGCMYFDLAAFGVLMEACIRSLEPDSIRIKAAGGLAFDAVEDWLAWVTQREEADQFPPERLHLRRAGAIVCVGVGEPWALHGAPHPGDEGRYGDSYALALYTREDSADLFASACFDAARRGKLQLEPVLRGADSPMKMGGFWYRVRRLLDW